MSIGPWPDPVLPHKLSSGPTQILISICVGFSQCLINLYSVGSTEEASLFFCVLLLCLCSALLHYTLSFTHSVFSSPQDQSNTEILLGVMSAGIVIYKNRVRINYFPWWVTHISCTQHNNVSFSLPVPGGICMLFRWEVTFSKVVNMCWGRQSEVVDGEAAVVGGFGENFGTGDEHIRFVTVQF